MPAAGSILLADDFISIKFAGFAVAEEDAEEEPAEAEVQGEVDADGHAEGAGSCADDQTGHDKPEETPLYCRIELIVGHKRERPLEEREDGHQESPECGDDEFHGQRRPRDAAEIDLIIPVPVMKIA